MKRKTAASPRKRAPLNVHDVAFGPRTDLEREHLPQPTMGQFISDAALRRRAARTQKKGPA